jgi:hypothetical protein
VSGLNDLGKIKSYLTAFDERVLRDNGYTPVDGYYGFHNDQHHFVFIGHTSDSGEECWIYLNLECEKICTIDKFHRISHERNHKCVYRPMTPICFTVKDHALCMSSPGNDKFSVTIPIELADLARKSLEEKRPLKITIEDATKYCR